MRYNSHVKHKLTPGNTYKELSVHSIAEIIVFIMQKKYGLNKYFYAIYNVNISYNCFFY